MSHKATAWAWDFSLPAMAKLVLLYIADSHNGTDGRCFPSISTIADGCGMGVSTVKKQIEILEECKLFIRRHRSYNGRRTSSEFVLDFDSKSYEVAFIKASRRPPITGKTINQEGSTLKGTQGDPGRSPHKGPLKKFTPARYIPPLPKEILKVVNIPRVLEPIVDLWMEVGIPHGDTTKALRHGVQCIQQVLRGEFFSDKPGYKNVKEEFEVSDVLRALKRFDKKRNDPDYLPSNKKALKSMGLADFFYNPYFRNGNGANGCSIFIQCLDEKPVLSSDRYQEFTEYIMDLHVRKTDARLDYGGASSVAKKLMSYWGERSGWLCRQGVTTPKRLAVMWIAMLNETRGQDWDIGLILSAKMDAAFESYLRRQA